ncbi:unnamed protein product [Toxocara canis]|uniref:ADP-ribosylation factor-like protein 6-interacting protein 4 n=1 Tax=Toxocara canis TaxID=6265 RepID=A0A183USH0_TOXCA|nr:unnamed protein product [Toxocara canis]
MRLVGRLGAAFLAILPYFLVGARPIPRRDPGGENNGAVVVHSRSRKERKQVPASPLQKDSSSGSKDSVKNLKKDVSRKRGKKMPLNEASVKKPVDKQSKDKARGGSAKSKEEKGPRFGFGRTAGDSDSDASTSGRVISKKRDVSGSSDDRSTRSSSEKNVKDSRSNRPYSSRDHVAGEQFYYDSRRRD